MLGGGGKYCQSADSKSSKKTFTNHALQDWFKMRELQPDMMGRHGMPSLCNFGSV